ncbi:MAG: hypothetical protein AAF653_15885, partial [Chloroflexota bacterium]
MRHEDRFSGYDSHPQARQTTGPVTFMWHYLLDLIFPPRCVHCGRVDYRWCDRCQTLLDDVPLLTATPRPPPP